jgi:hypothetical protein
LNSIRTYQKQAVTILIGLFVLILIGLGTFFHVEKWMAQYDVSLQLEEGFEQEELVSFTFSNEEIATKLDWKHAHEFAYQGKMYDVVEKLNGEDSTTLLVFHDTKETKVVRRLAKLKRYVTGLYIDTDQDNKAPKRQLVDLKLFCSDQQSKEVFAIREVGMKFSGRSSYYQSRTQTPAIPPPDLG